MSTKYTSARRTLKRRSRRPVNARFGRPRWPLVVAGVLMVTGFVVAGVLVPRQQTAVPRVAAVVLYTAPDAAQSAYAAPEEFTTAITALARDHQAVMVGRIADDGTVLVTIEDLTPRTASGEVLRVEERIDQAVRQTIDDLIAQMNQVSPTRGRALYAGLLQARLPAGLPVWLFSSGIDTTDPDDARDLDWAVSVDDLLKVVNQTQAVPDLRRADISFVMTAPAPAGGQELRASQTTYLHDLWTGLLLNASAATVRFIDMPAGDSASDQVVPIVGLPALPGTPVPPQPVPDSPAYSCTLTATATFVADSDRLVSDQAVRASLADCVAAITADSSIELDGWVAGPFGAYDEQTRQQDLALSQARCDRIRDLLVSMGVSPTAITRSQGHGLDGQPDPTHPTSQTNRVVVLTVTPQTKDN